MSTAIDSKMYAASDLSGALTAVQKSQTVDTELGPVRVLLADERGRRCEILLSKLKSAKSLSHQSTLTDEQVGEIRQAFGSTPTAPAAGGGAAAAAAAAASDGGRPKVILRRRPPNAPDDGRTDGRISCGTPKSAQS